MSRAISTALRLIHQAIDLSDAGDYPAATKLLTKAIAADPGNARAYFERGMTLLNQDQVTEAIVDFDSALKINPAFPGARDWRARAAASTGNHQQAADDRLAELRLQPDGPHAGMGVSPQNWADSAQSFIKAGNPAKAKELLETYFAEYEAKVTKYACYETAPMRTLAKLFLESGEIARASELARRAYQSKHRVPADFLMLALALEATKEIDEARKVCAEAVKINEYWPEALELQARLNR
jgi:tetratricopeptide (TPR) repeat protein